MGKVVLDGNSLTLEQVYQVVYEHAAVEIAQEAEKRAIKLSNSFILASFFLLSSFICFCISSLVWYQKS